MRVRYRVGPALLVFLAFAAGDPVDAAGQTAWQPSPGHTQIPIWPGVAPDAEPVKGPEVSGTVVDSTGRPKLVGGRPWVAQLRIEARSRDVRRVAGVSSSMRTMRSIVPWLSPL
jgi:hypothetical protein